MRLYNVCRAKRGDWREEASQCKHVSGLLSPRNAGASQIRINGVGSVGATGWALERAYSTLDMVKHHDTVVGQEENERIRIACIDMCTDQCSTVDDWPDSGCGSTFVPFKNGSSMVI